jgi:integrase
VIGDFQLIAEIADFFRFGLEVLPLRVGENIIEHSDAPLNVFDFVFPTVANVLAVDLAVETAREQVIDRSVFWKAFGPGVFLGVKLAPEGVGSVAPMAAVVGSIPRVIEDDIWAKLLWAGLNLTPEDVARSRGSKGEGRTFYPIEMTRAIALVWLFCGLRRDEIRRLRVGCIRWQQKEAMTVCLLDVPVHKTGAAFTKPIDQAVGQAINAWEKVRPPQAKLCDYKTGEMVDFLFLYQMRQTGISYVNERLIPRLRRKAGVPEHDLRGKITSHRARSTIATQLFNAKEPMSLFELQEWLGHRLPSSTQRYAKITPTKLVKSYSDAGYFRRNLRAIEVLIDQDKVRSGLGANEPWKFYDLGHGYCTYDFFDQCPHRMACAKCSFYVPKGSTASALLEGKSNLMRMRQEIPLNESELAALDDGLSALESLLSRLGNIPTPSGPTPLQLRGGALVQIEAAD